MNNIVNSGSLKKPMQKTAYKRIIQRLNYLIKRCEELEKTKIPAYGYTEGVFSVQEDIFYQWKTGALSFLKSVFGGDSIHYHNFFESCRQEFLRDTIRGKAVLLAAKEDIEGGFLTSIENLVSADIFTDFLEMAQYLLDEGYKDPAASLIGAVLEDGLRKVARNNEVQIQTCKGIFDITKKLTDAGIINRLNQSRLDTWRQIRNHADHGKFEEYEKKDVKEMLTGVRDFLASHI